MHTILTPTIPTVEYCVGQTILYDDPGVWAYSPRQTRPAVIVGFEPSKYHGVYLIVQAEGVNLPKRIIPAQVVGFVHPTLESDEAETATLTTVISA